MLRFELSPNFGDGRDQAAAICACDLTTSIPSVNSIEICCQNSGSCILCGA
jgi:hypothetical protein